MEYQWSKISEAQKRKINERLIRGATEIREHIRVAKVKIRHLSNRNAKHLEAAKDHTRSTLKEYELKQAEILRKRITEQEKYLEMVSTQLQRIEEFVDRRQMAQLGGANEFAWFSLLEKELDEKKSKHDGEKSKHDGEKSKHEAHDQWIKSGILHRLAGEYVFANGLNKDYANEQIRKNLSNLMSRRLIQGKIACDGLRCVCASVVDLGELSYRQMLSKHVKFSKNVATKAEVHFNTPNKRKHEDSEEENNEKAAKANEASDAPSSIKRSSTSSSSSSTSSSSSSTSSSSSSSSSSPFLSDFLTFDIYSIFK